MDEKFLRWLERYNILVFYGAILNVVISQNGIFNAFFCKSKQTKYLSERKFCKPPSINLTKVMIPKVQSLTETGNVFR